jgi:alpha-mannosidase
LFALALGNIYDANEAIRDQAGVEDFVFRFSLRGHGGGFDPSVAVRFGWEDNNPLESTGLFQGGVCDLPGGAHSFARVEPETAILAGFKPAEEAGRGLVVRVWEIGHADGGARLNLLIPGAPTKATLTDHLERDQSALPLEEGVCQIPLRACGVATTRFNWEI